MRLLLAGLMLCLLLGCQAVPAAVSPPPTEIPAPASVAVWGEVPKECA
jgi:hypothetical protein